LDNCNEKIILLQKNNPKERIIAENFGLTIYSTKNNIGIGPGNNFLINKLSSKYFIILQNDFELISDDYKNEIEKGIKLINSKMMFIFYLQKMQIIQKIHVYMKENGILKIYIISTKLMES
jgi:GT2 family glycosyltransferase